MDDRLSLAVTDDAGNCAASHGAESRSHGLPYMKDVIFERVAVGPDARVIGDREREQPGAQNDQESCDNGAPARQSPVCIGGGAVGSLHGHSIA